MSDATRSATLWKQSRVPLVRFTGCHSVQEHQFYGPAKSFTSKYDLAAYVRLDREVRLTYLIQNNLIELFPYVGDEHF